LSELSALPGEEGRMSEPMSRLLAWERGLLQADSLDHWLERVAITADGDAARLLLVDATHELRPLVIGSRDSGADVPPVSFVPSVAGLAPHLLAMHTAWRGDYEAADHALLFPGAAGLRHVAILPLRRGAQLMGLYTVASTGAALFAGLDGALLDHAADVLVTSLERHLDRARVLRGGLIDPLTGWNSARYLQVRLREELARAQRERGSVACLVADVDRLQSLNDEFGYGGGDRALQEVAARIESQVRASDAAARVGSDAFAVVLPSTDAQLAGPLAERILAAVRLGPVEVDRGQLREVRVSIGVAACRPQPGLDRKMLSDQLIADAIAALHRAKRAGGDRYEMQPG
jgi:diguanylate cyclase (GGDEF)-like protein